MASPEIFWASDPVGPGETVMVVGDSIGADCKVQVSRLPDSPSASPEEEPVRWETLPWQEAAVLQVHGASVKFVVPHGFEPGCMAFRISNAAGTSQPILLNRTRLTWHLRQDGATARPGGELRLFGRHLVLDTTKTPVALLGQADSPWTPLECLQADRYVASFRVPGGIDSGTYEVSLHNGFGGQAGWSLPLTITIAPAPAWPQTVFNVRDYGARRVAKCPPNSANGGAYG